MSVHLTENPILDDTSPGDPSISHIIHKDDQMRGYVFGEEVVALCGEKFIPTRDPENFPVCDGCKAAIQQIIRDLSE